MTSLFLSSPSARRGNCESVRIDQLFFEFTTAAVARLEHGPEMRCRDRLLLLGICAVGAMASDLVCFCYGRKNDFTSAHCSAFSCRTLAREEHAPTMRLTKQNRWNPLSRDTHYSNLCQTPSVITSTKKCCTLCVTPKAIIMSQRVHIRAVPRAICGRLQNFSGMILACQRRENRNVPHYGRLSEVSTTT